MATLRNSYSENGETASLIPTFLSSSVIRHLGLKPRDVGVFIHLLNSEDKSVIDKEAIARNLNICERTVGHAFTNLQKNDLLSYTRNHTGCTEWTINLSRFEGGI